MKRFYEKSHLAKFIGISRMQLYRLFKACPPPDDWFNPCVHKRQGRKDIYVGYDMLQGVDSDKVAKWLNDVLNKLRLRYYTRKKFRDTISKL